MSASKSHDQVRTSVSATYAEAVSSGGSCCGGEAVPKGVAAKLAGYTPEELASLPEDSVVSSFGCGNPLALSGLKEGDVVLDLGSGAGIDILLAGKRVGPSGRAIGIDMTDAMIVRARDNIAAAELSNVEVRKGIIEELPVEDASVDWVVSNCVINLSPEKERVFAEIARVLKPGGQMLVSDIVATDLPPWILDSPAMYSSCVAGAISEESYLEGLRSAGLEAVEVKDRLVYDALQIAAFAQSEEAGSKPSCCGAPQDDNLTKMVGDSLAGKVWSARVYAQKPR